MASNLHQFIVGLIVKYIKSYKAEIIYIDGNFISSFNVKYQLPPKIVNHRPDIIGVDSNGQVYIGEAKTVSDLNTERTLKQITDYSEYEVNGKKCRVIIGLPQNGKIIFEGIKTKLNIQDNTNINYLYIPEQLYENDKNIIV